MCLFFPISPCFAITLTPLSKTNMAVPGRSMSVTAFIKYFRIQNTLGSLIIYVLENKCLKNENISFLNIANNV